MYNLKYYEENNPQVIEEFIRDHPFAFLSGCDAQQRPVATQVPGFLEEIDGRKVLRGHIMRNTDHHKAFVQNDKVLVVFSGRSTYVSGTWYSNPNMPSTWNYMSVHVKGRIRFLGDDKLEEILRLTSLHFEDQNHRSATIFDNLPTDLTTRLKSMIVAFEISIDALDNVFKLSQDRDAESFQNIIQQLKTKDEDGRAIAAEMEKRAEDLFPITIGDL